MSYQNWAYSDQFYKNSLCNSTLNVKIQQTFSGCKLNYYKLLLLLLLLLSYYVGSELSLFGPILQNSLDNSTLFFESLTHFNFKYKMKTWTIGKSRKIKFPFFLQCKGVLFFVFFQSEYRNTQIDEKQKYWIIIARIFKFPKAEFNEL